MSVVFGAVVEVGVLTLIGLLLWKTGAWMLMLLGLALELFVIGTRVLILRLWPGSIDSGWVVGVSLASAGVIVLVSGTVLLRRIDAYRGDTWGPSKLSSLWSHLNSHLKRTEKPSGFRYQTRRWSGIAGLVFVVLAIGLYSVWNVRAFSPVRNLLPFTRTTAQREAIWYKKHLPLLTSDMKAVRKANAAINQTYSAPSAIGALNNACKRFETEISSDERVLRQFPSTSKADITKISSSANQFISSNCAEGVTSGSISTQLPNRSPYNHCPGGYINTSNSNACYPLAPPWVVTGQTQEQYFGNTPTQQPSAP